MKLIFTDLDGTLLDHYSYSFREAKESLNLLKAKKIPLIINTSKTKAEVLQLRQELRCDDPFIVENGAGIFFPDSFKSSLLVDYEGYKVSILGEKREEILKDLHKYQKEFKIQSFDSSSVQEVAKLTGLEYDEALRAKTRDFTEPFVMDKALLLELEKRVDSSLQVTEGGRFFHLISKKQDKGKALLRTKEIYEEFFQEECTTVALGDGKNDFSMLNEADIPVLIPKPNGEYENVEIKNHIKAPYAGPKGWNVVIKEIIGV